MSRGVRLVFVVVLLILVAGCSGVTDETPDREPYDVDETVDRSIEAESASGTAEGSDTDADTESPETYVQPELTTAGIVDEWMFFENHRATVANQSHTYHVETRYVDESGTVRAETEQLVRVNPGGEPIFVFERTESVQTRPAEPVVREYWIEDGNSLERVDVANGSVEYGTNWPRQIRTAPVWVVYALGTTENTTVTELDDGARLDGRASGPIHPFSADESIDIRLLVESDGLIRQYELAGVTDRDDEPLEYVERVRYVDVGETTAERPDWVEEATAELEVPTTETETE
ncbi:hypothetical protein [Natronoglomus mannanivorans]|uniref:Uncharacterized protein n=1 Tax=Natronoglomus mannanivorans TaxID=2979990 RepID=A0AAP2Z0D6_9EURY|nr:hypothetical protein [Halobacteria archaeon AArc-xg1-1]